MEWAGCLVLALGGVALIAAARNPDLALLRSLWGWRALDKNGPWPTRIERQETALFGLVLILVAAGLFLYVYLLR